MKITPLLLTAALLGCTPFIAAEPAPPNVLFIAIDDLNDWVGCLGGHPQVKTPNIDKLAQRGVLFTNAHCAAPLCNPSRAAVFSGRHPFETGVFANDELNIRKAQPDLVLLPQHFQQNGYRTFGTGKLLHQKSTELFDEEFYPPQRWSPLGDKQADYTADELASKATENPRHVTELKGKTIVLPLNRMPSDRAPDSAGGESFDWGPLEVDDADMGDGQIATWSAEHLRAAHAKPFFIGTGFYRPHIPLFAPKPYFDLYDGLEIQLPPVQEGDLDDLSPTARKWAVEAVTGGAHENVVKHDQWPAAVKAYMACVSFVDAQIGRMIASLEAGPNADNTAIVLWSDHGWHLGEKQHWGKWTGWQRSTRVVLMVVPPRNAAAGTYQLGSQCNQPASLLDLYPTLIELCGLPPREGLSGRSLVPALKHPQQPSDRAVITTFGQGNHAVTTTNWRYIRYADGAEEIYDSQVDPNEWTNLAGKAEHAAKLAELRALAPKMTPAVSQPVGMPAKKKKKKP